MLSRRALIGSALAMPMIARAMPTDIGSRLDLTGTKRLMDARTLFSQQWVMPPPKDHADPYAWGNPGMNMDTRWMLGGVNSEITRQSNIVSGMQNPPLHYWAGQAGEINAYPTADGIRQTGANPFSLTKEGLAIQPKKLTLDHLSTMGDNPKFSKDRVWYSGSAMTFPAGLTAPCYFEFTARLPPFVSGIFPAFWLLSINNTWPGEIDILEALAPNGELMMTTSMNTKDPGWSSHVQATDVRKDGATQRVAVKEDPTKGFHRYGCLLLPDKIAIYWDRFCVKTWPMPSDLAKTAMYPIFDYALGGQGTWAGTLPPDTHEVGAMVISDFYAGKL